MEERSNDLNMHVDLFQRLEFIEKCNKANGVYNEEFEQEHSMILDALETIRQRMRNPYIQGRSKINQATKSTEVVEDSPLELEEFSSTVEITHANEVTLPEFISQQILPGTISTKVDHSQILTTKDQINHMIGNTNHVDFNYEEFIFGEYFNYSKPMKLDFSLIGTMRMQDYQTKVSFVKSSASLLNKSLQQYLVC